MNIFSSRYISVCIFFILLLSPFPIFSATFTVDTSDDAIDVSPGDGSCKTLSNNCSLRAAIMESNSLSGADRINLSSGIYALTIGNTDEDLGAEGDLDIWDDVVIEGSLDSPPTINGSSMFRIFSILQTAANRRPTVNLKNLILTQGLQSTQGNTAVILNYGILGLDNVTVENAGDGNFAIVSIEAFLQIENSRINDNDRAILSLDGEFYISDSDIKRNISTVDFDGAGIVSVNSRGILENVNIEGNIAQRNGGGIAVDNAVLFQIRRSNIFNNSAINTDASVNTLGGGLYFSNSNLFISESVINSNNATYSGGGIWLLNGDLTISKSQILNNKSDKRGGGILYVGSDSSVASQSRFSVSESIINHNQSLLGGGISILTSTGVGNIVTIEKSEIVGNIAEVGAGISYFDDGELNILNTTISGNQASQYGGGLYVEQPVSNKVNIKSTTINNNAANLGANIFNFDSAVSIANTIIANGDNSSNCSGTLTSLGFNLSSDDSCSLSEENDLPNIDPMLGRLNGNGGLTRTHALLEGSLGINAGDDVVCQSLSGLDQRNFYRGNSVCDIGAVEYEATLANSGEIKFSETELSVNESSSVVTFLIKRLNGSEGEVSVFVFSSTASTAKLNDDYFFNSGVVSWADGDSEDKRFSIRLADNDIINGNRSIVVSMNSPKGNVTLLPDQSLTIILQDDEATPGEIIFAQNEFIIDESKSSASVTVLRKNGVVGDITFRMSAGIFGDVDATIKAGQNGFRFEFDISFAQDIIYDGDQRIELSLISVGNGASIGTLSNSVLIIRDDEVQPVTPGVITFSQANYSADENQGKVSVEVTRTNGQQGNVYVMLSVIPDTAIIRADFEKINGENIGDNIRLLFRDGQTIATLNFDIINDEDTEVEESFQLLLSDPLGGATIGDISSTVVSIVDDDFSTNIEAKPDDNTQTSDTQKGSSGATNSTMILFLFLLMLLTRYLITTRKHIGMLVGVNVFMPLNC